MKVTELMQTRLITIAREAPVKEAVMLLAEHHISALPVIDQTGHMVGVLSASDVLQAESEAIEPRGRNLLFEETRVDEIMTPRPLTIHPEAPVAQAAREMLYAEVHRLFVEVEGKLVGVISQSDLVRSMALRPVPQ